MSASSENFDVIVIGAGPAGSTTAALIAMQGHRVLVLDRDEFPRHQIGESLLPATVNGICGILGLREELAAANFPRKRGGTFRWGLSPEPWTFKFARDSDAPGGFAYQVERSRFDKMLVDNAQRRGADIRLRHTVEEIIFAHGRAAAVRFTDTAGKSSVVSARFIIDAGGNGARRYNEHVGKRIYSKLFQNIALYAYFEGGKRLPSPNQGNILCCAFEHGWFWYIPLSGTLTSVGAVVAKEHAGSVMQAAGREAAFGAFVKQCPMIGDYLSEATRVTEGQYGHYRVRTDYSYCNTAFWRPGLALIGDAACFVDPVFSSGVHLATYSALLISRSINTCLAVGSIEPEETCFAEFERRYRREYGNFYQFCSAFYDMDQTTDSYFWAARKILNTEERGNEAFVRLVAGMASGDDPVFSSSEFFQARIGLGVWFQDMMSRSLQAEGVAAVQKVPSFNHDYFDPSNFMRGFTSEITQVQLLAMYGDKRPVDEPLSPGGLIPSKDGLHWKLPAAEA